MRRAFLVPAILFLSAVVCSAQTTFYFPQVADGGGWKTTIFITNPAAANTSLANVTITFTKSNGTAFNVPFVDSSGAPAGDGNTLGFQVAGGQTRKFVSVGAAPGVDVGFASVTATAPVNGTAVFSQFSGGRLLSEAGVPTSQALARQGIFVDTQGGFYTAVAMANPAAGAANLTLQLMSTEGVQVATTTRVLNPNNHTAAFVHELFQGTPGAQPLVGSLQITGSTAIPAIALRFSPDFSAFTTLPPVSLASLLSPALKWFDQRPWLTPLTSIARLLDVFQFRAG
jgi:hypothetical protein